MNLRDEVKLELMHTRCAVKVRKVRFEEARATGLDQQVRYVLRKSKFKPHYLHVSGTKQTLFYSNINFVEC